MGLRARPSEIFPEINLVIAAAPSANPSIIPTTTTGAPRVTVINIGRIG
ncbi:unannotated protein [freshwater metagenome]|uniref:Unannotated protein n=1 Tax=freshwater metagenome TaxID=449393 RepID=A0A6J7GAV8_9ZZZZ